MKLQKQNKYTDTIHSDFHTPAFIKKDHHSKTGSKTNTYLACVSAPAKNREVSNKGPCLSFNHLHFFLSQSLTEMNANKLL